MRKLSIALLPVLAVVAAPTAYAHPGEHAVSSLLGGFAHPWSGLDHLLAMLAVGMWSAWVGRSARWVLPVSFVGWMLIGMVLAGFGAVIPALETGITASVVVLGLLIAGLIRLPLVAGSVLVGFFAIFHGYAHAAEGAGAVTAGYALGLLLASATLHLSGIGLADVVRGASQRGLRYTGAAIAGAGALLSLAG